MTSLRLTVLVLSLAGLAEALAKADGVLAKADGAVAKADGRQGADDPKLRAAVERFFGTQEAEDVDGYLSLWSTTVQRPRPEQLKYIFEAGDDKFSEIAILGVFPMGERVRVRVSVTRDRVTPSRIPGGPPLSYHTTTMWSLTFAHEGDEWKLLREGSAVDGLAESLIESTTPEQRNQLLEAEPDLVNDNLIMALSRRAGSQAQMQAYAAAQIGFERMRDVARLVGNPKLEGEALQNLANAMYFQRNFQGALHVYEERLALERARANEEGITGALLGIATIRYSFAEYGPALTSYREALAIQERLGDEGVIATTLLSIGNVLYLQGDYDGAIAGYTRSRDISRKTMNTAGEADALEGMGRVFVAQGNYAAALDAFAGVLAEGKARNSRHDQGTALLSIGLVHFRLANLESARAALDEGRRHFEASKNLQQVGRAWQAIALTDLVSGRFVPAEEEYKKSSAACDTAGDQECVASATVGLAFAETAQDKFQQGIASYKKAIDAFAALKHREQAARAEIGLSLALAGSGAHRTAVDRAAHARGEAEALGNDDVLWRALVAEAGALRKLREAPRAMSAVVAAVAAIDRLVAVATVRPSATVSRDSSSAFAMLALLQAEAGDAAAAFESVERMHVHDLRMRLAPGERDISRGMTDVERDEERALSAEMVSLHAQLSRERELPKPDAERIARLETSIAEAARKRTAQRERLFERLPALRTWRGLMSPATRADVTDLLTETGTILVEFVVGDDTLLVIVARRGEQGAEFRTHFEAASRKVLAERVAKLMNPDTLRDATAWKRVAAELIPGLPATLGSATRAIVIPHEVLWRVPFEALPVESGYLSEGVTVVYAPSASAVVRASRLDPEPRASSLLLVAAAPQLEPPVVERIAQTAPGWTLRTSTSAEQEIKAIVSGADPERETVLTGSGATEGALRERLPSAEILHLTGPFRINGASPLFSPLMLAHDPSHDGTLEAREIINLDLHARIAIVSDGAAMSMRDAADEVAAVAWAWRAAGVPAIAMPRWPGDDVSANQLLAELHARLRAGDSPDVALQAARAKIRSSADRSAPFHWAAWMLIGGR